MLLSLAQEVETAVASGDPTTRMTMLRRTTDLFLDHSGRLGEREVLAFETVLLKLARNVETAARAALAESLADVPTAPRVVVQDIARDADIAVAAPVLMRSSQISESDLVQIAEERGQAHLFALSRRRTLSERVTDVLLRRGDDAVLRSVAGNDGARISTDGFDRLAAQADLDEALQAALAQKFARRAEQRPRARRERSRAISSRWRMRRISSTCVWPRPEHPVSTRRTSTTGSRTDG